MMDANDRAHPGCGIVPAQVEMAIPHQRIWQSKWLKRQPTHMLLLAANVQVKTQAIEEISC